MRLGEKGKRERVLKEEYRRERHKERRGERKYERIREREKICMRKRKEQNVNCLLNGKYIRQILNDYQCVCATKSINLLAFIGYEMLSGANI